MEKIKILRIYVSSTDKINHKTFYEEIIGAARDSGLEGATVYQGIMGYGKSSGFESPLFWEITQKVPVTIEIIDTEEKISKFVSEKLLPLEEKSSKGALIVSFDATLILSKKGTK